jgi:hypothetical protein
MKIPLNILAVVVALTVALYAPYGVAAIQEALQSRNLSHIENGSAELWICGTGYMNALMKTALENLKISGVIFVIELAVIVRINLVLKRRQVAAAVSLPADTSFDDATQYD